LVRKAYVLCKQTILIISDNRHVVVSIVHATKAIHVTNEAECGQCYEQNKSTKLVLRQLVEVHNGQSRTGHSQCLLTCDFDFWGGGVSKRKKKLINPSIKLGPPPAAANSMIQPQNLQKSEINAAGAIEAATTNLNRSGDTTINANLLTTSAALSNLYSTMYTTTFHASLSLPMLPTVVDMASTATSIIGRTPPNITNSSICPASVRKPWDTMV
jgi:hypothetical protein